MQAGVSDTVRNAISHLTPSRVVLVADSLADITACRDIVPVLRFIARALIQGEIDALATAADGPDEQL